MQQRLCRPSVARHQEICGEMVTPSPQEVKRTVATVLQRNGRMRPMPKAQAAAPPSLYPKQETYLPNRAFHSIVQLEREGNRETDRFHWYLANAGAPLLLDVWRPTGLPASIWNVLFTTVERDRQPTGSRLSRCHRAPAMNRSPGRQEDELGWPLPKGFAVKSRREVADK